MKTRPILCAIAMLASAGISTAATKPINLRCEYLVDPLSVEASPPRLSWEVTSDQRGARQTAYQLLVASSSEALGADHGDRWDSGRVASGETLHIPYGGRALRSGEQVWWKVRVADADASFSPWSKPATWRMGLLTPADWQAQWISHGAELPPVRPARNGYHSALRDHPETNEWVQSFFPSLKTWEVDEIVLWPARPYDWSTDTPGFLFPPRFRVRTLVFGHPNTLTNLAEHDFPNPGTNAVRFHFSPPVSCQGVGLWVERLAPRGDGKYAFALAEIQAFSRGTNVAQSARVSASSTTESASWSTNFLTDGDLTSHGAATADAQPATYLRREFKLPTAPRRATLHASALGVYEARLNGSRIGDHVLAPEWTDYHHRVQYQTYDVTGLVRVGTNCLAAVLGDGWYAGRLGMSDSLIGTLRGVYGRKPWFLAQLELDMPDGSKVVVASDSQWQVSRDGAIRSSDLLDGEVQDLRRELAGWDRADFGAAAWSAAAVRGSEPAPKLVAQPNEPIRVIAEVKPVASWQVKPDVRVFDFGQNLVGRCQVTVSGTPGTTLTLRHAEMTNADGSIYVANLRGAPQIDRFTLRGAGREVCEPRFTQHGFRFLEVSGMASAPGDVLARVFNSSAREVGEFECSDPTLTKLWRNIRWTQRGNLVGVPTDCPQRDERLGWMGDIQAFSQTAIYQMDMAAFFTKWLQDVRDGQAADGRFPDFAPHPFRPDERFSGVPAWGDAGVIVPWRCYVNYGDRRLLEQHFDAARRWIERIRRSNPDGIWNRDRGNDYNDWLNGDTLRRDGWPTKGGAVPAEVMATAFHQHSSDLVRRMAQVLGGHDAPEPPRVSFATQFLPASGMPGDTQAGYALALDFGLVPAPKVPWVASNLVRSVEAYGGRLSTGIQSTHRLLLALSQQGRHDLAWKLVTSHEFPSWGYMIDNGATTIWERWDGFVAGRGFQDPGMNSFNHWALGSVGEWLMRHAAGIAQNQEVPAWGDVVIAPRPGGGVTWARGSYHSIRGLIRTEWHLEGGRMRLAVELPANTTATVVFAGAGSDADVTENGKRLPDVNRARTRIGSGSYLFEWEAK